MVVAYTGMGALFAPQYRSDHAGFDNIYPITTNAGLVTIPANSANFHVNGSIVNLPVAGLTDHSMYIDVASYVVADYNGGSPRFDVISNRDLIDYSTIIPYAEMFKRTGSSSVHTQMSPMMSFDEVEKNHMRMNETTRYSKDPEALLDLTVDYGLNIGLSGGEVWAVNYEYLIPAITIDTRLFMCLYYGGQWVYTSGKGVASSALVFDSVTMTITRAAGGLIASGMLQGTKFKTSSTLNPGPFTVSTMDDTTIHVAEIVVDESASKSITFWPQMDNLHYNDINAGNGLGNLIGGQYGCLWLWRGIEDEDHIYGMLARQAYSSISEAMNAVDSAFPPLPTSHGMLVAKIIVAQGDTAVTVQYRD